ncbi:MAG TPA: YggT family protein [Candidatus Hydrogenedentes bacterium]|nr:YggT family protein [Candidatus Hydrogenedentota bacterium]HIJ73028.1 YggT family protein [Candidatus Hydrogenedentota bacterium]
MSAEFGNAQWLLPRAVQNLLTLYMIMILLRWLGTWIEVDVRSGPVRWICRLTDPLIQALRRLLPPMGPIDFGPPAALFLVWVVRILSVNALVGLP